MNNAPRKPISQCKPIIIIIIIIVLTVKSIKQSNGEKYNVVQLAAKRQRTELVNCWREPALPVAAQCPFGAGGAPALGQNP